MAIGPGARSGAPRRSAGLGGFVAAVWGTCGGPFFPGAPISMLSCSVLLASWVAKEYQGCDTQRTASAALNSPELSHEVCGWRLKILSETLTPEGSSRANGVELTAWGAHGASRPSRGAGARRQRSTCAFMGRHLKGGRREASIPFNLEPPNP